MASSRKPCLSSSKEEVESVYRSDAFRMFYYKIQPCSKRYAHDWTACPFSHENERARRRCPRSHHYAAVVCPEMQRTGSCARGDSCSMAHTIFEYWLHPDRYRTQLCKDGASCERRVCFFAHCLQELRTPGTTVPNSKTTPAGSAGTTADGGASLLPSKQQEQQQQQLVGRTGGAVLAAAATGASTCSSSNSPLTGNGALTMLPQWPNMGSFGYQLQAMAAPATNASTSCAGGTLYSPSSCAGGIMYSPNNSSTPVQLQPPAALTPGLNSMLPFSRNGSFSSASTCSNIALPQSLMPVGSHPGVDLLLQPGQGSPAVAAQLVAQPVEALAGDLGLSLQLQQLNRSSSAADELLSILARQFEQHRQEEAAARAQLAASSSHLQAWGNLLTASSAVGQAPPAAANQGLPSGWY